MITTTFTIRSTNFRMTAQPSDDATQLAALESPFFAHSHIDPDRTALKPKRLT